jgi:hypothetical protein
MAFPRQPIFPGEHATYDRIRASGYVRRGDKNAIPHLIPSAWIAEHPGGG